MIPDILGTDKKRDKIIGCPECDGDLFQVDPIDSRCAYEEWKCGRCGKKVRKNKAMMKPLAQPLTVPLTVPLIHESITDPVGYQFKRHQENLFFNQLMNANQNRRRA